jgi:hypothetical protein
MMRLLHSQQQGYCRDQTASQESGGSKSSQEGDEAGHFAVKTHRAHVSWRGMRACRNPDAPPNTSR